MSERTIDQIQKELNEAIDSNSPKTKELVEELVARTKEHTATMESLKAKENQEKIIKIDDLKSLLNDKPETTDETAEITLKASRKQLKDSIDQYIQGVKNTNQEEVKKLQDEVKAAKDKYETAKYYFLGKIDYKTEDLSKISTQWIRWGKKTKEGGVVKWTPTERLQFSTLRRRMTVNKLVKKFNTIGDNFTDGARFIMGFDKSRILRYTGAKMSANIATTKANLGIQMTPEKFHERFTKGKENIFAVLNKGEKTDDEDKIIKAIIKRINYYGYSYARQRATAWTDPFLQAEKNTNNTIVQKDLNSNKPQTS